MSSLEVRTILLPTNEAQSASLEVNWREGEQFLEEVFDQKRVWENDPFGRFSTLCSTRMRSMSPEDAESLSGLSSFRPFQRVLSETGFLNGGGIAFWAATFNNPMEGEQTMRLAICRPAVNRGPSGEMVSFQLVKQNIGLREEVLIHQDRVGASSSIQRLGDKLADLASNGSLPEPIPLGDLFKVFRNDSRISKETERKSVR